MTGGDGVKRCGLAVIGGGPAGLTAGLYGARGAVDTVVFERQMNGGQIVTTAWVENYPAFPKGISGADLGELLTRQAEAQGAHLELFSEIVSLTPRKNVAAAGGAGSTAAGFELKTDGGQTWLARAVILATGAVPRKLGIPGEARYTGRGVSWCATCDAAFYRGKTVAVIGGGDAAVEEALFLTKFAAQVYLVHRRDEFRATPVIVERARAHEQLEFVLSHLPLAIEGDGSKVTGLRLRSVPQSGGGGGDRDQEGRERSLAVDGVFEFVGIDPVNDLVKSLLSTEETGGFVSVAPDGSIAELPGLFAAGDVTNGTLKQVVTAAGGGATAAFSALQYLTK